MWRLGGSRACPCGRHGAGPAGGALGSGSSPHPRETGVGGTSRQDAAVSDLLAARSLFGLSLVFHIIFAAVGVAMPLLMVLAEWRWRRTGTAVHLELARRWAKGTAILFAVGAVSGTVISFELGPALAALHGASPARSSGCRSRSRASRSSPRRSSWASTSTAGSGSRPRLHLARRRGGGGERRGLGVLRDARERLDERAGRLRARRPDGAGRRRPVRGDVPARLAAQVIHMLLAAYAATGFAVAGIHALLPPARPGATRSTARRCASRCARRRRRRRCSSRSRATSRRQQVARTQPVKLAALEGQFGTERGAPLRIGGLPDAEARRDALRDRDPVRPLAPRVPRPERRGEGARDFPREDWPPVPVRPPGLPDDGRPAASLHGAASRWLARGCGCAAPAWPPGRLLPARASWSPAPLGFVALEAGWTGDRGGPPAVDVHGRAAHRRGGHAGARAASCRSSAFTVLYVFLAVMVIALLLAADRRAARPRRARAGRRAGGGARREPGRPARRRDRWSRSVLYALLGGRRLRRRDLGSARDGPAQGRAARAHRARHRPDLGGEPRLADPGGGGALHRLPARLRRHRRSRSSSRSSLLLVGIVLRGAAFTFRTYDDPDDSVQARWGLLFSGSSVVAPVMLGVVVGAVASGRLDAARARRGALRLGLAVPAGGGLLRGGAVRLPRRDLPRGGGRGALRDDFRRRAIGAGVAVFLGALLAGLLSWREAPLVFAGLTRRGWSIPLHLATGAAAVDRLPRAPERAGAPGAGGGRGPGGARSCSAGARRSIPTCRAAPHARVRQRAALDPGRGARGRSPPGRCCSSPRSTSSSACSRGSGRSRS